MISTPGPKLVKSPFVDIDSLMPSEKKNIAGTPMAESLSLGGSYHPHSYFIGQSNLHGESFYQ